MFTACCWRIRHSFCLWGLRWRLTRGNFSCKFVNRGGFPPRVKFHFQLKQDFTCEIQRPSCGSVMSQSFAIQNFTQKSDFELGLSPDQEWQVINHCQLVDVQSSFSQVINSVDLHFIKNWQSFKVYWKCCLFSVHRNPDQKAANVPPEMPNNEHFIQILSPSLLTLRPSTFSRHQLTNRYSNLHYHLLLIGVSGALKLDPWTYQAISKAWTYGEEGCGVKEH